MKPSVMVCLLVRDEEATVARCLESVREFADRWLVVDTGSTDNTLREVQAATIGWDGEMHQSTWKDFGTNRNELLDIAGSSSDWILLLDADHTLKWSGDKTILHSTADGLLLPTLETTFHWNPRLVRTGLPWRYVGRTHEYLQPPAGARMAKAGGLEVVHHADGGSRGDKFQRDLRILREDVLTDPLNARSWFYLATTLKALGDLQGTLDAYAQRVVLGGWSEEVYCAWWDSGTILKSLRRSDEAEHAFRIATRTLPHRSEASFELARLLNQQGRYGEALEVTSDALAIVPRQDDRLHVHPMARPVLLPLEHGLALQQTGNHQEAIVVYRKILGFPGLPGRLREVVSSNLVHALQQGTGTTL